MKRWVVCALMPAIALVSHAALARSSETGTKISRAEAALVGNYTLTLPEESAISCRLALLARRVPGGHAVQLGPMCRRQAEWTGEVETWRIGSDGRLLLLNGPNFVLMGFVKKHGILTGTGPDALDYDLYRVAAPVPVAPRRKKELDDE